MIGVSTSAHTRAIAAAMRQLGITGPKPVNAAYGRRVRIVAGARDLGNSGGLAEAVAQAIADGDDPTTSATVQRIINSAALAAIAPGVAEVAETELGDTIAANADSLIAALRKPFDQAAATLVAAHTVIGDVALEDTTAIISQGPAAATSWAEATKAVGVIDSAEGCWFGIANLSHLDPDRRYKILRIADVPPPTWFDDGLTEKKLTAWQIVCAGYPLRLPLLGEYRGRVASIHTEQADRQAAEERRTKARLTGIGVA